MRVALLLSSDADLGLVWRARAFANALVQELGPTGRIVVGLPLSDFDWEKSADRLRQISANVEVRAISWTDVDVETAARMHDVRKAGAEGVAAVMVPRDSGWNFRDCDLWILCVAPSKGAVVNLKPTIVYSRDLSERYVPTILATSRLDPIWTKEIEGFLDWRERSQVMAASERGVADLSVFAGVRKSQIVKIPSIWETFRIAAPSPQDERKQHILLLTGASRRYEAKLAVDAYRRYVAAGGSLRLLVAGPDVMRMRPSEGSEHPFADAVLNLDQALEGVRFLAVRDDTDLADGLAGAAMIWSNAAAESEPDSLAIAGQAGLPYVGVDQASTREMAQSLGITASLYQSGDFRTAAQMLANPINPKSPYSQKVSSVGGDKLGVALVKAGRRAIQEALDRVTF